MFNDNLKVLNILKMLKIDYLKGGLLNYEYNTNN